MIVPLNIAELIVPAFIGVVLLVTIVTSMIRDLRSDKR